MSSLKASSAGSGRYVCGVCGKAYPSNQSLMKHLGDRKAHAAAGGKAPAAASAAKPANASAAAGAPCDCNGAPSAASAAGGRKSKGKAKK